MADDGDVAEVSPILPYVDFVATAVVAARLSHALPDPERSSRRPD